MIKKYTYCFVWMMAAAAFVSCDSDNAMPSLAESFSKNDKNPFGTYVAHDYVSQLFYSNNVNIKKTAAEKSLVQNSDTSSLHINISKSFFLTNADLAAVLGFVSRGNSMFISSEYFDSSFLKQLNISTGKHGFFTNFFNSMKYTAVHLQPAYYADNSDFRYYYLPFNNSFTAEQDKERKILGTNEVGEPNFIVVFYGKGRFYLHCEPRVFSNYFLLQDENYKYLQQAFSFVPAVPEHVYWDDYYNKRNKQPAQGDGSSGSGFSVLLRYPPMAWAFWLTLMLLLLYILFGGKRRQRIIKPLPPNENTSVAFTETVSRLYLQNKDNRNIADKMIAYFFEHVRNQYFLVTNTIDDDFASMLSRKSNVPREDVDRLIASINKTQQQQTISDQQLLSLNHQIENFYKHKQ